MASSEPLALCEIKTMSNSLLASGYVKEHTTEYIEIIPRDDKLPLLGVNTFLKVCYSYKSKLQIVVGVVYLSGDNFLRLVELEGISSYEKRNFFRVATEVHAKAALDPEDFVRNRAKVFDVAIHDISLGGLLLESQAVLIYGQDIFVKLPLEGSLFQCRLCRVQQREETWIYGCEFVEPDEKQQDFLCKYIFQKQREQIAMAKQRLY